MDDLRELQKNWEGFAQTDPLWAICTDPLKKNKGWTREEFLATGRDEIDRVLECAQSLGLKLDWRSSALDFGCGVGRLTRALASRFAECWGVDISPTMIRLAEEINRDVERCHFLLNEGNALTGFEDNRFGFIYTSIVLQHIPPRYAMGYIRELIRILRPGGVLIFQVPDRFQAGIVASLRHRLALRRRLQRLAGMRGSYTMEMHCIPEPKVRELVRQSQARVIDVRLTNSSDPAFNGSLRYLDAEPAKGYVSKQYCVVKNFGGGRV